MIRMLISIALNRHLSGDPRYVRCATCGTTASEREAPLRVLVRFATVDGHLVDEDQTPPEWTCPSCGRAGPLQVGELLPNDTLTRCRRTLLCRYRWKVPGSAKVVICPRCYTAQPGPAA
ncbi:hypothetical protein ETD86_44520 [Nonomuraea turkmeniaca]|uniref:Uncharacterized protein n=1 Tax=Nonomuraea turkmeniaca TaxID=103838 RepID=A0A5S4F076_9ACTN|nr:hypothetical protein [Nonomuraea turkmeniaca]TMR09220.1 hypothetical protein ETD86_44520 [Nonomuraea turkmeniaca]